MHGLETEPCTWKLAGPSSLLTWHARYVMVTLFLSCMFFWFEWLRLSCLLFIWQGEPEQQYCQIHLRSHNGPINVLLVDRDEAISSVLELTSQDGSDSDRRSHSPMSPSRSQTLTSPIVPTSLSSGIVADHSPMLSSAGATSSQGSDATDLEVARTGCFLL